MKVTVVITGPDRDCYTVMQRVADDADYPWILTKRNPGQEFAQLSNGKDVLRIYENGDKPLAASLADVFQRARWRPQLPTGLTASP
jgi:hypothetical protein